MSIDNKELNIILDRINQWITNCDVKSSVVLGFNGIILSILITGSIWDKIIKMIKSILINFNEVNFIYLIALIISILLVIIGIIYLLLSIFGRIRTDIYKEEKLITDSLIYYGTINNLSFKEYLKKANNLTNESLSKELISQIYINSTICTKKFKNYNRGLILSIVGIILLFIIISLGYIIY